MKQGANFVDEQLQPVPADQAFGVCFCVYAPRAESVLLCLFNNAGAEIQKPMKYADKGLWQLLVKDIPEGQHYGFRSQGDWNPIQGHFFNPAKLLVDPCARQLEGDVIWHESVFNNDLDDSDHVPRSVVRDSSFDWQNVIRPETPIESTILYELHVKGFTWLFPDIPEEIRGTYSALSHPRVIEYLVELGITAVELQPVTSFISEQRLHDLGLSNYWGYNPLCFGAPHSHYAHKDPVTELKTMVRELHKAGIEVILDVVFNHNCEGGSDGPLLSLKGLAGDEYFHWEYHEGKVSALNYSGCGNTLNFDSPQVQSLTIEALCHWSSEYHIDGFRFDLAPVLGRYQRQFSPDSPFLSTLRKHPQLRYRKIIVEPWDLGPDGYHLGAFPDQWLEWNDRFRIGCRKFWRGDDNGIVDLAWRLDSSSDIFPDRPHASVNYLCSHDGFTLNDLVSYQDRHNQANGENNRDGNKNNVSWNFGVEGETDDPGIQEQRLKARFNLLATLMFARGTPMLLAGDEYGNTQSGNNNGYCQDSHIGWLNWEWMSEQKTDGRRLSRFTRQLIQLRKQWLTYSEGQPFWYDLKGTILDSQSLLGVRVRCLQCSFNADNGYERLFVLFNNSQDNQRFILPGISRSAFWHIVLDTSQSQPSRHDVLLTKGWTLVQARSVVMVVESAEHTA